MREYTTKRVGRDVLQGGLRHIPKPYEPYAAKGLLLRGVVVATYVSDDPNHPQINSTGDETFDTPKYVYCDVLVYSNMPAYRWRALKAVLVMNQGGMHDGRVWKPRAATVDINNLPMDVDGSTNPAHLDGDHVLIGFMDDSLNEPVIIGGVPHPSFDIGNENRSTGHRLQLKLADGDPDFIKHHGSFYGVDDNGDYVVDTTFANDGKLKDDAEDFGSEQDPPTDGKGAQRYKLSQDSEHQVTLFNMTSPDSPSEVAKITLNKDEWQISFGQGETITIDGQDAGATLTLGDGAVSAIIAEAWEAFFDGVLKTWLVTHTHPTAVGPTNVPIQAPAFPAYSVSGATSTKVKFPNG